MKKYVISPSKLDQFRLYMANDWLTLDSLIDTIKGVFTTNFAVQFGSACHAIMEFGMDEFVGLRVAGGFECRGIPVEPAAATEGGVRQ